MTCIKAQCRDRLIAVPKAQQRYDRIDESFGHGSKLFDLTTTAAHPSDFAVRATLDTTVGSNILDNGFAVTEVCDRLRRDEAGPDSIGGSLNDLAMKDSVEARVTLHAKLANDSFGGEIAAGCVVLMQCMNGDMGRLSAGGFS